LKNVMMTLLSNHRPVMMHQHRDEPCVTPAMVIQCVLQQYQIAVIQVNTVG